MKVEGHANEVIAALGPVTPSPVEGREPVKRAKPVEKKAKPVAKKAKPVAKKAPAKKPAVKAKKKK